MIRKMVIAACLLPAVALAAVVVATWRGEWIVWGKDVWVYQRRVGGVAPMYWEIRQGTRGTFAHGEFVYSWSYCPQPTGSLAPRNLYIIQSPDPFNSASRDFHLLRWTRDVSFLSITTDLVVPPSPDTAVCERVSVPFWGPLILLMLYPAFTLMRGPVRRWRRRSRGLCMKCGYDLTGNVSGVCPECGKKTRPTGGADEPPGA